MLIGVTGSIASGKSTVMAILKGMGFATFDADEVVRELYESGSLEPMLRDKFPDAFLYGKLDLRRLADIVFSAPDRLRQLEEMVHPLVRERILQEAEEYKGEPLKHAFVEVQLLVEADWQDMFDHIFIVFAPLKLRLRRALGRGLTEEDFYRRDRRQASLEERLERCGSKGWVLVNTGSLEELRTSIEVLLKGLGIIENSRSENL